jgi:membrane protein required for colicin V production
MNWLDVVLVLLFAAGLVAGYRQGLLRQALSLGAIACGVILGTFVYMPLAGLFAFTYPDTAAATVETAAFLLAVVALVTGLEVLQRKAVPETRFVALGILDRVAGLLVAVLAVFLQLTIVVLVFYSIVSMSWPIGETIRLMLVRSAKSSLLVPLLYNVLVALVGLVGRLLPEGGPRFLRLL